MRSPITRANRRLPSRRFAPSINAIIVGREDPTRASPSAKPTNMCIYSGFVTYNFVKLAKTRLLLKRRKNIAPEYSCAYEQIIRGCHRGTIRASYSR